MAQVEGADGTAVYPQIPPLKLVKAHQQLDQARFARAGVPHNRQRLPRRNRQRKILQDGAAPGAVVKCHLVEHNFAAQPPHRLVGRLHHQRLVIDQGKHPLAGGQSLLELAPERGQTGDRVEENRQPLDKQVPLPHRNVTIDGHQPADVNNHRDGDAGNGVEQREDAAKDGHAGELHPVGQLVHVLEIVVDGCFLAEIFGHGNAADRLLDGGVDRSQSPLRLLHGVPRQPPEDKGNRHHYWPHGKGDERQRHILRQQHQADDQHQHNLAQ